MAGKFSVITPEATTNLVTNPSVEVATTGYTAVGGSVARSATYQRYGVYSLAVTPTAGTNDGVYFGSITLATSTSYTFSVDVKGANGIPYRIYLYDVTGAAIIGSAATFTGDGEWHRQEVTATTDSSHTSYRVYVEKNSSADTSVFYIDGLQVEAKSYATTYIDGDQTGGVWVGAKHASTSTRSVQEPSGGKVVNFDTYNVKIGAVMGAGMPPVQSNIQQWALRPGAPYQSTKVQPRVMTLRAHTDTSTEATMYTARKNLTAALRPDRTAAQKPLRLRYNASTKVIELDCVYEGGLEGNTPVHYKHEFMPLRFAAYDDPYWREVGNYGAVLDEQSSQTVYAAVGYIDGSWTSFIQPSSVGGALDVYAFALDARNNVLYIGGGFTDWDGIANADNIVKYDLATGTYSAMGTGCNDRVQTIAVAPDGNVYVGGLFTLAGGVANTDYIARWDGSAWQAMGTGVSTGSDVFAIAVGIDGYVYVGGTFTQMGGVANTTRIARWDGSAWSAMSTGASSAVYGFAIAPDGDLYVGGAFTTIGGVSANYIAKWDGSAFTALGAGMSTTFGGSGPDVRAIAIADNGDVFAVGTFTTAGTVTANCIAKWNGSAWSSMAGGVTAGSGNIMTAIYFQGSLIVGGGLSGIGGLTLNDPIAIWNGTSWRYIAFDLPTTTSVLALAGDKTRLFIGMQTTASGTFIYPTTNTITNSGDTVAYPVVKIKRSGGTSATIQGLNNFTSGVNLLFNLSLLNGETITIDFRPGRRAISSDVRSVFPQTALPASGLSQFNLLPGSNAIEFFVLEAGSPTVTATMEWRAGFWGVDGAS